MHGSPKGKDGDRRLKKGIRSCTDPQDMKSHAVVAISRAFAPMCNFFKMSHQWCTLIGLPDRHFCRCAVTWKGVHMWRRGERTNHDERSTDKDWLVRWFVLQSLMTKLLVKDTYELNLRIIPNQWEMVPPARTSPGVRKTKTVVCINSFFDSQPAPAVFSHAAAHSHITLNKLRYRNDVTAISMSVEFRKYRFERTHH